MSKFCYENTYQCLVMHFGKGMSLFVFHNKLQLFVCLGAQCCWFVLYFFNVVIIFTPLSHSSPDPHLSFIVVGSLWMKIPPPPLIFVCSFMVLPLGTRGRFGYWVSAVAEMCAVLTFDSQRELLLSSESHKAKSSASVAMTVLAFEGGKPAEAWQHQVWKPLLSLICAGA